MYCMRLLVFGGKFRIAGICLGKCLSECASVFELPRQRSSFPGWGNDSRTSSDREAFFKAASGAAYKHCSVLRTLTYVGYDIFKNRLSRLRARAKKRQQRVTGCQRQWSKTGFLPIPIASDVV